MKQKNKRNQKIYSTYKAHASAQNEKTIQCSDINVFVRFLRRKYAATAQQIDESYTDYAVNVKN